MQRKCAFFVSLPDTNNVRQFLLKIHFFDFSHFWMTTLKKTYFYRVFCYFPFLFFFFFFVFLFLFSNIKKEKSKKCNFLFKNLIFDNPKFCKNTILTHCDTICVTKKSPKNTIKLGKKQQKKTWTSFQLITWTSF